MESYFPREGRGGQYLIHITKTKISKGTSNSEGSALDTLTETYFPKEYVQHTAINDSVIFETWLVTDCLWH